MNPGATRPRGAWSASSCPGGPSSPPSATDASWPTARSRSGRASHPCPPPGSGVTSRIVELRRKRLPDPVVARRAAAMAREAERRVTAADLTWDATYHALVAAAYAELIADQAEDPERDGPVHVRASALAIGPLLHLGCLGRAVRRARPADARTRWARTAPASRPCATARSATSPRPTPSRSARYEPNASVLQPGEGERLVEARRRARLGRAARLTRPHPIADPRIPRCRRPPMATPIHATYLDRAIELLDAHPRRGGRGHRAGRRAPSRTASPRTG